MFVPQAIKGGEGLNEFCRIFFNALNLPHAFLDVCFLSYCHLSVETFDS